MLGLLLNGGGVIEGASWVDEVFRIEDPSTIIALIPTCVGVVAVRAFAFDEAVREKSFVVETIELGYLLAVYEPVFLNFEIEVPDEFFVDYAFGSRIIVELYLERLEKLDDQLVVLVRKLARRYTQFDGLYLNGGAVLVAPTDHDNVFALQSKVACVNIGGQ